MKAIRHFITISVLLLLGYYSHAQARKDSVHYPISDRRADALSNQSNNPFDYRDTSLIKRNIEYDPKTKSYYIVEKVGNSYYRVPTYLTYDEFWRIQSRKDEEDYFKKRAAALTALNLKTARPKLRVYDKLFDRIFGTTAGGLKVDIKPTGEVNIMAGYQGQNIENPTLPERARKNGGFDFDMNAKLNVNANIGDKLKFPINYNTLSNLSFDNQLKLDYKGMDDEIIKSLEAGNISFPIAKYINAECAEFIWSKNTITVWEVICNCCNRKSKINKAVGWIIRRNIYTKLSEKIRRLRREPSLFIRPIFPQYV